MLFGAQYDDDSSDRVDGPSPTQPRKKKTSRSAARSGAVTTNINNNTPGRTSSSRRTSERRSTATTNGNHVASPSSSSYSYQSTSSSSLTSLASSFNNENNNYNYNYNLNSISKAYQYAAGNATYDGAASSTMGRTSISNTPVKTTTNGNAKRRNGDPVKRYSKLFGVLDEIAPAPRPIDKTVMYPSVWKELRFRKKMIQLASSLSVKPICVTGVDGFLASWIVCELLKRGYRVRGTVQNRKDDVSGIMALPAAKNNFTIVETSLLTPEACDMAVQGCDFVIHTGTPSSCSVRDPLSEQQEPGVHSIGSRMHCIIPMMTNFIQACARARVKRVVLTSSVAAMADSVSPHSIVNDACWNISSSLERNPHFLSLKLAEEAAWQLVDQLPRDRRIDLVTINPGTLFGPALSKGKLAPGNQVIYDLITGQYSALVDLNWSMVDVRDCALAHIAALENSEARGRYICVNKTVWMKEIVDILSHNGYSGRDLPWRVGLPNWVARLPAYSAQLGQVGAALYAYEPNMARPSPYLSDKINDVLNVQFRRPRDSIIESANDLLKWGLIKPWAEDHEAIDCACCKNVFTFYRRKHHCRECGEIICHECSMSRAVVEGSEGRARLCDKCVKNSIPELVDMLKADDPDKKRKAVVALESLLENEVNHDYVTRFGGIVLLLEAMHNPDDIISAHAAGALCALSSSVSSTLHMVLEGAVLQMLEVEEASRTWGICLQALRNIWKQINRADFRRMLHAVARVSADANIGELRGNILLTFVHMMDSNEVPNLLSEGLFSVLYHMLQSSDEFHRCAAAHAIKHLVPQGYDPDLTINVPPYLVDDHEELFLNSSLSDLQFLVKGHIAPINAHKVVLFFRNSYFKNMVRFGSATSQTAMIEVNNCSYEVFSILLRFLYTGKVDITPDIAVELLQAASFYCVLELQKRAEEFLSHEIRVDNVVNLLSVSEECNAEDLKKNCIPYLMRHIHEVVRLPSFTEHRVQASEEVLKALASVLGPEWEASYLKFRESIEPPQEKKKFHDFPPQRKESISFRDPTPMSLPREAEIPEYLLNHEFLLSPIPPPSNNGYQPSFATVDSPLLYSGMDNDEQQQPQQDELSYAKTFSNTEMLFNRPYGFSEDLSEGISEGVC
uniref:FYVE-type domain-containing protein n=1 Tax=Globisporangium ultimum (strain ATCC 200006 / CBS 805.95 / DAOM BR144) TaxID=431595 RepID=K3WG88_GLOUD